MRLAVGTAVPARSVANWKAASTVNARLEGRASRVDCSSGYQRSGWIVVAREEALLRTEYGTNALREGGIHSHAALRGRRYLGRFLTPTWCNPRPDRSRSACF